MASTHLLVETRSVFDLLPARSAVINVPLKARETILYMTVYERILPRIYHTKSQSAHPSFCDTVRLNRS